MAKKSHPPHGREKPSLVLLALVSQFLANNGFSSSSRIFNTERKKRPKSEGWMGTLGRDFTANTPTLETIFKQWEKEHKTETASEEDGTSSSGSEQESASTSASTSSESGPSLKKKTVKATTETQVKQKTAPSVSSSSDSESDDDSASGSDSDSDSDAMVDEEVVIAKINEPTSNPLKRKASDTSSSTSDTSSSSGADSSDDESSSSEDEAPVTKKAKIQSSSSESSSESDSDSDQLELATNVKLPSSDSSDDSTSSDDSSEDSSESDESDVEMQPNKLAATNVSEENHSESSGTVTGDVKSSDALTHSNVDSAAEVTQVEEVTIKRKHVGAQPTRLAQLSASANLEDYVSNDYISYDYADKAYRDLIVTRGKGFTKEKNKKKRGSYRGGTIDTSGGKGFKFED